MYRLQRMKCAQYICTGTQCVHDHSPQQCTVCHVGVARQRQHVIQLQAHGPRVRVAPAAPRVAIECCARGIHVPGLVVPGQCLLLGRRTYLVRQYHKVEFLQHLHDLAPHRPGTNVPAPLVRQGYDGIHNGLGVCVVGLVGSNQRHARHEAVEDGQGRPAVGAEVLCPRHTHHAQQHKLSRQHRPRIQHAADLFVKRVHVEVAQCTDQALDGGVAQLLHTQTHVCQAGEPRRTHGQRRASRIRVLARTVSMDLAAFIPRVSALRTTLKTWRAVAGASRLPQGLVASGRAWPRRCVACARAVPPWPCWLCPTSQTSCPGHCSP